MDFGKEKAYEYYVGVAECYVKGFNLTQDQIIKTLGYDPGTEKAYSRQAPTGEKYINLVAYVQEKHTKKNFRVPFFIEEKGALATNGNMRYVNAKCSNSYGLPGWFVEHDYRQAFVGESELLWFIKCWLAKRFSFFSKDPTSGLYPLKENLQIFKENYAPFNDLVKRYPNETVGVLLGVKDDPKGLRQDVYNKAFVIGSSVPKVMGSLTTHLSPTEMKAMDLAVDVRDFLNKAEGAFGYKGNFGTSYKFRKYGEENDGESITRSVVNPSVNYPGQYNDHSSSLSGNNSKYTGAGDSDEIVF